MHIPAGFHVPGDAAVAPRGLSLALPAHSSAEHIPSFLWAEFRTKMAFAEGLIGIKADFAYA